MANNRMFLVNQRTREKIYLAKYYPSSGWYASEDVGKRLNEGFDESQWDHLSREQLAEERARPIGEPHKYWANYGPFNMMFGDVWQLEYESVTTYEFGRKLKETAAEETTKP